MLKLKWFLEKIPIWKNNQERRILSGEQELLLFVSSVMNDKLSYAREEVVKHISSVKGLVPWAFEFTPASSEDVEEGYLRKVRESDFVIWLVGNTITTPVENEIREALASDRRLLVFLMTSAQQRDERVNDLISEVGARAKWSEVSEDNPLTHALESSVADELIRAIRGKPGLSRIAKFNELINTSRARCIARWQAAGISLSKAIDLFEDPSVGRPPPSLIASISNKNVIVLTGSFGSGKSLMAERILQEYIRTSVDDSSAPVPVYLKAQEAIDDLSKITIKSSEGLGNPKIQGVFIVVDGVDEAGISSSTKILEQARILVRSWKNTSVLITSRPLPVFSEIEENFEINLFEEKEIINLVSAITETDIASNQIRGLPDSVREAIKRPFFSILWARFLLQNDRRRIRTTGELINYLIEDVIQFSDENILNTISLLEELGSISIDNGGAYIPWRQLGNIEEMNMLLETRLVEKTDGRIGFPLPILTQWFAANGLINNRVNICDLCQDLPRLDRWRYPLIVIVSLFPYEEVSRIISPVVEANPGLVSEIIEEGIARFGLEESFLQYSAEDCGSRIQQIYSTFIKGFGELAKYMAPIDNEGNLHTLGVSTTENRLLAAWYDGEEELEDLLVLPIGYFGNPANKRGWYSIRSGAIGSQPAWPWRWCMEDISNRLNDLISRKVFVVINGHMHKERLWEYALNTMQLGDLFDKPILLEALESKVDEYIQRIGGQEHTQWHELNLYIESLKRNGEEYLHPLWPSSDIELHRGGWIWEPYSDDQVLKRAIAVYSAAIEEYENLVSWLFPSLRSRMLIATLFPVKMHGVIEFSESAFGGRSPGINWYFEPLSVGSENQIEFTLGKRQKKIIDVHDLFLINQKLRPDSREWISAFTSYGVLDIFHASPVTKIVYKWLEDDLSRINML